jgi:hypothetical protein
MKNLVSLPDLPFAILTQAGKCGVHDDMTMVLVHARRIDAVRLLYCGNQNVRFSSLGPLARSRWHLCRQETLGSWGLCHKYTFSPEGTLP